MMKSILFSVSLFLVCQGAWAGSTQPPIRTIKPTRIAQTEIQVMKLSTTKVADGSVMSKSQIACQYLKPTGVYEISNQGSQDGGYELESVLDNNRCMIQLNGEEVQIHLTSTIQLVKGFTTEKVKLFEASFYPDWEHVSKKNAQGGYVSASTSDQSLTNLTLYIVEDRSPHPNQNDMLVGETYDSLFVIAAIKDLAAKPRE